MCWAVLITGIKNFFGIDSILVENKYVTNPDVRQDLHTIFCGNCKTEKDSSTSLLLKAKWDCLNNSGVKFSSVSTFCIGFAVNDRLKAEESEPLGLGNDADITEMKRHRD